MSQRVGDTAGLRLALLATGGLLALLIFGAPLAMLLTRALAMGGAVYLEKISDPFTVHAAQLTVLTALVVVPINTFFGVCAAWLITRHRFPGRDALATLIELPISVSPVVAGVAYLFLYGSQGLLGPFLGEHGWRLMFTAPAIFLASLFVSAPYVARELITVMQGHEVDGEEAALTLGATGFLTFLKVTLPNVRWALFYGVLLCNARVIGEFGAVSVVSGKIRGKTETLPLHIETLFNDYNATGAFAAASLLAILAVITLILKSLAEWRLERAKA
ncbi:sulfate ABC transporter permease subunit CysW [Phenylobacterium sp. LjRoot225]|uniref:sulfate ABC transporter permease subunit CysW n=1 Tax=Phenylobacterium sp. LjRoot225 TaxID=3342285 RepID=UPI003ECE3350